MLFVSLTAAEVESQLTPTLYTPPTPTSFASSSSSSYDGDEFARKRFVLESIHAQTHRDILLFLKQRKARSNHVVESSTHIGNSMSKKRRRSDRLIEDMNDLLLTQQPLPMDEEESDENEYDDPIPSVSSVTDPIRPLDIGPMRKKTMIDKFVTRTRH